MHSVLILLFVSISFVMKSQDEIITKEYQYDPDPDLKISTVANDTVYYVSKKQFMKLPIQSVVAIRRDYRERGSFYLYMRPAEQRIYGIRAGNVFFKSDYRFSTDIPEELAKLYFMEKFRIYENIPNEYVKDPPCIINKETGEKKRLPHVKGFYVVFKSDKLHREIKCKVYASAADSTQLIVKADISGETNIYSFNESDIEAINIQSDGALVGRIAMGIVSQGNSWGFYQNKWLTRHDFKLWSLGLK